MAQESSSHPFRYALGHEKDELDRLISLGWFMGDLTEHVLRLAGITSGMRVLDAGCGAGEVTFLAARLVGLEGEVIGVDISPEAIEVARQRAAMAGLENVRFLAHDLNDLTLDTPVDALIGRLVLQYNADPARLLRHLGACVKPGGIVAFQEGFFKDRTYSEPVCQLYETTIQRVEQTFARIGTDPSIGGKLGQIFRNAGLPAPRMILHARVERGPDATVYKFAEQMVRSMLPLMEGAGVATADEIGLETLADRLSAEAVALDATLEVPGFIGAWTRTPLTTA